jgi:hypothetical protein
MDREPQRVHQHQHGGVAMKPNQPQKAEEQLPFNFDDRKRSVCQSRSLNELENIMKIINEPVTTRGSNCDEQK